MEFCRILEKHNFEKIHTFQQDLSNNILIQGHKTGIRKSEMLFCCTSKWGGVIWNSTKSGLEKFLEVLIFFSKYASYVPLCCSLKGRKWDIETFETVLNSSHSELFNALFDVIIALFPADLSNGCSFKFEPRLWWKYRFWAIQRRFERLNISFSPLQRAS